MTTIEFAALCAAYVMALARLATIARPLWNYGPPWVQALLPAAPIILTQLAGQLGAVKTTLDLTEAGLVAMLAVGTAVRGAKQGAALALLAVGGVTACAALGVGGSKAPAVTAAEAYRTAANACALYRVAPAELRTPEADSACRELADVCIEAPPPAYGNKVVSSGGAAGADAGP
jgi:hypothetical protein